MVRKLASGRSHSVWAPVLPVVVGASHWEAIASADEVGGGTVRAISHVVECEDGYWAEAEVISILQQQEAHKEDPDHYRRHLLGRSV